MINNIEQIKESVIASGPQDIHASFNDQAYVLRYIKVFHSVFLKTMIKKQTNFM